MVERYEMVFDLDSKRQVTDVVVYGWDSFQWGEQGRLVASTSRSTFERPSEFVSRLVRLIVRDIKAHTE